MSQILNFLCLLGILVLATLFLYRFTEGFNKNNIEFTEDFAFSLIVAEEIIQGEKVLLGPPSHLGGRQVGPIYYWSLAIAKFFSTSDMMLFVILSCLKVVAFLVSILIILKVFFGRVTQIQILTLLACLFLGTYAKTFIIPWHGNFMIIPASLVLLFFTLTYFKDLKYLPIFFFSSVFLFQTYLASSFFILLSYLFILYKYKFRSFFKHLFKHKLLFCLSLALFVPTLLFEFQHHSNFLALLGTYQTVENQPVVGLINSLSFWTDFLSNNIFGYTSYYTIILVLLLCGSLIFLFKKYNFEQKSFLVFSLLNFFIYVLILSRMQVDLAYHYAHFLFLLPILFVTIFMQSTFLHLDKSLHLVCRVVAVIFISSLLFAVVKKAMSGKHDFTHHLHSYAHAEDLVLSMKEYVNEEEPVRIINSMATKINKSAYYYLLGQGLKKDMQYLDFFPELNAEVKAEIGFLTVCPVPYSREKKKLLSKIEKDWLVIEKVTTRQKDCELYFLRSALNNAS